MIDFDATVAKAQSFETVKEARAWVITIIGDLVDLKRSPGGGLLYKNLLRQIVAPFNHKGKGEFLKEIETYIKAEEYKRTQEKFEEATEDKQREQFDTNENGIVLASQKNIVSIFTGNKYLEFQYDTLTEQKLFRFTKDLLWHEGLPKHCLEIKYPHEHAITGLTANRWYLVSGHLSEIKLYLHQFFPEERRWFELDSAIEIVTKRNQINIHRDYIDNGLPAWDSEPRFDFLYRHAGVTNREWATVIGKLIFLGIVARCYEPGYDFRGTVILEGAENIGKSWLTKSIAFDDRFTTPFTFSKNNDGYESARQLRGQIVVELADKGGIDSKSPDQIKAFLTYTHDVNRRMQSDDVEHLKRIAIFIITCNESGAYLKSDGGEDTRFYPARCNGKINVEAIIAELPQLYAQAKHLWDMGVTPRPTEDEMKMQQEFIKSRQLKPTYYYYVLERLKLHQNTMVYDSEGNWDDGFTIDEMLGWMEQESWFQTKSRTQHRTEIRKVLTPYFHIESVVRKIPREKQIANKPDTTRKWRYTGPDFISFVSELED